MSIARVISVARVMSVARLMSGRCVMSIARAMVVARLMSGRCVMSIARAMVVARAMIAGRVMSAGRLMSVARFMSAARAMSVARLISVARVTIVAGVLAGGAACWADEPGARADGAKADRVNADGVKADGAKAEGVRVIRKEATVNGPLADVWDLWTTSDGVVRLFPQKARIELAIGGAYEWYFNLDAPEGQRGSEGCKVLAFVPQEMLAFSWNAPPSIAKLRESGARTQVVVRFEPQGADRVRVMLTQAVTESGPDWDAYYQYFDQAWPKVLERMQKRFGGDGSAENVVRNSAEPSPRPSPLKGEGEGGKHSDAGAFPASKETRPHVRAAARVGDGKRKQWAYYIRPARDDFDTTATPAESKIVTTHAAYIQQLTDEGTVRYAGRSVGEGTSPSGAKSAPFEIPAHGIVVFEADSESEAKTIMESDPAVREGVFLAKLKPFQLVFEGK